MISRAPGRAALVALGRHGPRGTGATLRRPPGSRFAPVVMAALVAVVACGGSEASSESADAGAPGVADSAPGPTWRGVYSRDRDLHGFRPCGAREILPVATTAELLARLDAKVDFHAPRPTTTVFVQMRGDTSRTSGAPRTVFRVTAVDSSRELEPGECAAARPPAPPRPPPGEIASAIAAALGPDSALGRSARAEPVWLNGDELGDLLVLLTVPAACNNNGCTLLALEGSAAGYRLVGRTASVRAPVEVRQERTDGYQQVAARVGQGIWGDRTAVLRFSSRGYPSDAALQPDAPSGGRPGRVVFRP